jgi:hypothetical protein
MTLRRLLTNQSSTSASTHVWFEAGQAKTSADEMIEK